MRKHHPCGLNARAMVAVLAIAAGLLFAGAAKAAETKVYLFRGWFGIFSTGLDSMADDLRNKGIRAETLGHLAWRSTVSEIVQERASGKPSKIVLVGHSQGANNVIDMARMLEAERIPVDLVVTLAPLLQDPIPGNVVQAINYYHAPGWGAPVTAEAGYRGTLSNVNLGGDLGLSHITMDKSPELQAEIERAIVAVARAK
jgi:hypothetical protein